MCLISEFLGRLKRQFHQSLKETRILANYDSSIGLKLYEARCLKKSCKATDFVKNISLTKII